MLPRIRWMMQVCTMVAGHTAATESGRPFKPSQTRKNTSATPRLRSSVNTAIQNFADSPPPSPNHMPKMSLCPSRSTPIAAYTGRFPTCPSRTLTVIASMKTAA
jgi:hypothetical protein